MLTESAIKRLVEPEEVASLVGWLTSDAASMVTGASYTIDGGWTARSMITHKYRTVDVAVSSGSMRVGVWDPIEVAEGAIIPDVLVIHGVTSNHHAWPLVVSQLPDSRVIAPDLRGRGSSNTLQGSAGLQVHAADLVAVLDAFEIDSLPVLGHSMGGFVAVVLAHYAPDRIARLVLIDGGLPFEAPAELAPEQLVPAILGPTAERLSMRFATVSDYLVFWRVHPVFTEGWSAELETYFAYDLVPADGNLRTSTSLGTTTEDTIDMNTGTTLNDALESLGDWGRPVTFVSVPRGLRNEVPGLYPTDHLNEMLPRFPAVKHVHLSNLNHYTVVMGQSGAAVLGEVLHTELGALR